MSKLIKVKQVWYDEEPRYPGINSGLIIELEDGRKFRHSQDGMVVPFEAVLPAPQSVIKEKEVGDGNRRH